ncbi:MAG: Fe-S oxidoreductase [Sphingobium sp.]
MKRSIFAMTLLLSGMAPFAVTPVMAQMQATPEPEDAPNNIAPAPRPPVSKPADPNAGVPMGEVPPVAGAMAPADPASPVNPVAPVGSPDNPAVVGGNMTAPPAAAKDYPKCTKTITDGCVNPGEARKMKKR